jgi:hypothetical protein
LGLERQVEPLVMASEIMGLPPFHGYLKFGNLVVRLRGAALDLPEHEPDFVPRLRPIRPNPERPVPADPSPSTSLPRPSPCASAVPPEISTPSASSTNTPADRYWD